MSYEEIIIPGRDLYSLAVRVYDVPNPKAVVKCIHGMEEHQGRYQPFAEFLNKHGYAVVTADLRGHGKNAPKLSHIADKNGHKLLIEDEKVIKEYIQKRYPGVPLILFGHSMGTIISRALLQSDSKDFTKVVLSGYPNPMPVGAIGGFLSSTIGLFKGRKGYSKMLTNMVLGPFNKALENPKTPLDWLSYNEANVIAYDKDPLCGEEFTIGSYNALFHLVGAINSVGKYKNVNVDCPILLISGEDDPCTSGEKGRKASLDRLQKAGFKNIEVETIKGMRHEILNETGKEQVYEDILKFLEK